MRTLPICKNPVGLGGKRVITLDILPYFTKNNLILLYWLFISTYEVDNLFFVGEGDVDKCVGDGLGSVCAGEIACGVLHRVLHFFVV